MTSHAPSPRAGIHAPIQREVFETAQREMECGSARYQRLYATPFNPTFGERECTSYTSSPSCGSLASLA